MAEIVAVGQTRDDIIGKILQARVINRVIGGAAVGPGDIDLLQDDFIEACNAIEIDIPRRHKEIKNGRK